VVSPKPCSIPSRRPVPEKPRPGKPMSSLPPALPQVLAAPDSHAEGVTLDRGRGALDRD